MANVSPSIEISHADREHLKRIALKAADAMPDDDGAWLCGWVVLLLRSLPPDLSARDEALRELYRDHTDGSDAERRDEIRRLCRRYETGRWRVDQHRSGASVSYAGTRDALLFKVFEIGRGPPPLSDKRLGVILSSDCFYKRNGRHKMRFSCPK